MFAKNKILSIIDFRCEGPSSVHTSPDYQCKICKIPLCENCKIKSFDGNGEFCHSCSRKSHNIVITTRQVGEDWGC